MSLTEIQTPYIIEICHTIKKIQSRIKDPENSHLDFAEMYSLLQDEFREFADTYTNIFTRVVKNKNIETIAANLYYRDRYERGLISESELTEMLAEKYFSAELFDEYKSIQANKN